VNEIDFGHGTPEEFIIWGGGLRLWHVPTSYRRFIHIKQVAAACAEQCHPHWTGPPAGSLATTRHKKWFRFPGIERSTNCFLSFSLVRPSTKRCEGLDHIHPREDGTQGAGSSGTAGGALREEWCGEEGDQAEEDAVVVL
jgi:hypothetical protein